ncbi:MAG: helix-turn-helix domain-containing protein [Candidatus Aenigmatarchaeota archaeon]
MTENHSDSFDTLHISTWLEKQGYEIAKDLPLGGKIPDVLALKTEITAIEVKKRAEEVQEAIDQCLHYLNECNKVYVALPSKELEKLNDDTKSTLKSHGIGLISVSRKKVQVVIEAVTNKSSIFNLLMGLRKKELTNRMIKEDLKARIMKILERHQEGITILDISKILGVNRNTVTKYIYELSGAGMITQRKVGTAKLCFLAKKEKGEIT